MRFRFLILLLLSFFYTFSQKDSIIVKGIVKTQDDKKIEKALIHLISSQGHRYEYKTDSSGKYRFHFQSETVFSCTVSIASDKHTTARKLRNLGFLATKDVAIFELKPGNVYEKNFELTEVPFCGPIAPSLLFYKNSILSYNDSLHKKDSINYESFQNTINLLYLTLIEEPGIVIEIQGHASNNEKNPQELSEFRVQLIKEILVAKGINKNRILTKSWGSQKLLIRDDIIKKAKTKEEKNALHLKNQRVIFRIISWDFKE